MNPKIWTRNFIVSIVLAIVAIGAQLLQDILPDYYLGKVGQWSAIITNLIAFNYIYRHGTFSRSKWKKVIHFFTSFAIIAMLFRIQHWPGGSFLIIGCCTALAVSYTLWFSAKLQKKLTDVLKWIWVIACCALAADRFLHMLGLGYIGIPASNGLLFLIYILVHIERAKMPAEPESEWDFDKEAQR